MRQITLRLFRRKELILHFRERKQAPKIQFLKVVRRIFLWFSKKKIFLRTQAWFKEVRAVQKAKDIILRIVDDCNISNYDFLFEQPRKMFYVFIWFGLLCLIIYHLCYLMPNSWLLGVLWHISLCRIFTAKSYMYIYKVSKVGDCSRGRPEGSLFNSYYTEV